MQRKGLLSPLLGLHDVTSDLAHLPHSSNSYNPRVMEKIEQDSMAHTCFVLPVQDTPFQCKYIIRLLPEDSHEQKDRVCVKRRGGENAESIKSE